MNYILMNYIFTLFLLVTLSACSEKKIDVIKLQGSTMGTQYHISIANPKNSPSSNKIKDDIDSLLLDINQQMSTYIADSQISKFNRFQELDWFPISTDFAFVIKNAQQVSKITDGSFDITVAPLVDLWGFGSKVQYEIPDRQQIYSVMKNIGYQLLQVQDTPPALKKQTPYLQINLSAIAKGFAVDKVSQYLASHGFKNHLVEIGGEIRSSGKNQNNKLWNIAIENPDLKQNKRKQSLQIGDTALATSGNYQNYFMKDGVRYSHTINPKTGLPIKHKLASATVIHSSAMLADAYATAIMVMGETKGKQFAQEQKLKVNLIYKDKESFKTWENIH